MHATATRVRRGVTTPLIALIAAAAMLLAACGTSARAATSKNHPPATHASTTAQVTTPELNLYLAMRTLWDQHMEWTYATVIAFVSKSPGLTPTLTRLLQNQTDIGNAIVPYYGQKAGNELSALLHTHINDAVPVLTDAADGNTAALSTAEANWYANAKQIADFLSAANPKSWPKAEMESMMKTHITQTIAYAVDQLKGNFAQSITDYDTAEAHMDQMGNMLAQGIIAQFPSKFTGRKDVTRSQLNLDLKMQALWDQHMEWTYNAVTAFVSNAKGLMVGLNPTLARILQNQSDIGNEFALYYGKKDGNELSALLHTHINDAVPVLTDAADGNTTALNTAVAAWYANAKQVADFMSSLNPHHWAQADMESMWHTHITQTIAYAVDQLKGNDAQSITDYDTAETHMEQMGTMLASGIIAQFPARFGN